jgi:hypothetical protein
MQFVTHRILRTTGPSSLDVPAAKLGRNDRYVTLERDSLEPSPTSGFFQALERIAGIGADQHANPRSPDPVLLDRFVFPEIFTMPW